MNNSRRKNVCILICTIMLSIYIGAIFYLNLSITPAFYNTDMYEDVMVAVEMWKEKTVFPSSWVFGNQLYVFSTPVLAAVFFGVTGNPFLSMGIASCFMAVIVILSFHWMLESVFPQLQNRLIVIVAFLGLVLFFGDAVYRTNGWQLLFTMCAFYACYATTVFLAFGCFLRCDQKIPWIILALTCVLSFAMGIQSLRQTAVMVLPLVIVEGFAIIGRIHRKEKFVSKSLLVTVALSIANIAGIATKHCIRVNQVEIFGVVSLAKPMQYVGSVVNGVRNVVSLLGNDSIYGYGLLLVGICLLTFLVQNPPYRKDKTIRLLILLALSVFSIFGIEVVTTMHVRDIYYFMLYPLLACTGGYFFAKGRTGTKLVILTLLLTIFSASLLQGFFPVMQQVRDSKWDLNYQIGQDLIDRGITTVYSHWNACEKIAVANSGKIRAGFWNYETDMFIAVPYLCNLDIYDEVPEKAAYVFYSQEETKLGVQKALDEGVEMMLVAQYPEESIYIYTAPVNLFSLFSTMTQ